MAVTSSLSLAIVNKENVADGRGSANDSQPFAETLTFVDAAGALGVTARWGDTRTLTGTESLDFAGGVTNRLGVTKTFTKNKVFAVRNPDTNASGTITVGGGSNPFVGWFTGSIVLSPGEFFCFGSATSAGKAVVAGTGDLVQVVASVAAMTYDIIFMGEGT